MSHSFVDFVKECFLFLEDLQYFVKSTQSAKYAHPTNRTPLHLSLESFFQK